MALISAPRAPETPPLIRVVFADDSAAIRTLARYALSAKRGFNIVGEASDGAEALSMVQANNAECVVLDIEMPGMGGFEALAQLQRLRPNLPVVMLSGHSDPEVNERSVAAGAAAYLEKGSGLSTLAETVRRVAQPSEATTAPSPRTGQPTTVGTTPPPPSTDTADSSPADTTAADLRRLEYVVSHDLAEPARIMTGFSKLLAARYADELGGSGQLFLDHIQAASGRLQAMIDDLLLFSRAGRSEPSLDPVPLDAVVAEVFESVATRSVGSTPELVAGQLPTVLADRSMITTVLQQLVLNGLLFNTSTSPTVTVEGTVDGDRAVVTVTDNGIGISTEHQREVFELFRRLNTREEYEGTGTGLALCQRLITLQHGTIALRSTLGTGTTVTLCLQTPTPGASR